MKKALYVINRLRELNLIGRHLSPNMEAIPKIDVDKILELYKNFGFFICNGRNSSGYKINGLKYAKLNNLKISNFKRKKRLKSYINRKKLINFEYQ